MINRQGGAMFRRLLLCLLLGYFCPHLEAQNRDPVTRSFTGTAAAISSATRDSAKFVLGWNWGKVPMRRSFNDSLHINTVHTTAPIESHSGSPLRTRMQRYPARVDLIPATAEVSQSDQMPYAWAPALQWDPTISNTNVPAHDFRPRAGDTTGAVWGFAHSVIGRVPPKSVLNEPFNEDHLDFDRAIYEHGALSNYNLQNGHAAGTAQRVLADAEADNELYQNFHFDKAGDFARWGLSHVIMRDPRVVTQQIQVLDTNGSLVTLPQWADTTLRSADSTLYYAHPDSSEWYLTINTRRRNVTDHTPSQANAAVLSLRLRRISGTQYRLTFSSGAPARDTVIYDSSYIAFDSVSAAGSTYSDNHYGIMDAQLSPNTSGAGSTWFRITKNMFPALNAFPSEDVTRSAYFRLPQFFRRQTYEALPTSAEEEEDDLPAAQTAISVVGDDGVSREWLYAWPVYSEDPPIVSGDTTWTPRRSGVIRVQPEVWYHGGYDVAIDWLRIESRMARIVLRGGRDSLVAARLQEDYDELAAVNSAEGTDMRILRHYLADETPAMYWRASRHWHLLMEEAGSTELPFQQSLRSRYQSEHDQHWLSYMYVGPEIAAPYLPYGFGGQAAQDTEPFPNFNRRRYRTMSLKTGYRWSGFPTPPAVPELSRHYETYLLPKSLVPGTPPDLWAANDSIYDFWVGGGEEVGTFQPHYEINTAALLRDYEELFFDGEYHVWMNPWVQTKVEPNFPNYNSAQSLIFKPTIMNYVDHRPKTGEEFDLYMWTATLMGSKGYMYFKGGSVLDTAKFDGARRFGISRADIRADSSDGGDYMDNTDPFFSLMDVDSLAYNMGLDVNNPRFYVGSATLRSKMLKLHDWIVANEAELLRLQLLGYWNKGYKAYSGIADSSVPMSDFVDLNLDVGENATPRLETRRIHDDQSNAWSGAAEDAKAESFVAFTVLRDRDQPLDSVFYLGVVNRRTDPVVYDPGGSGIDLLQDLRFYSTNEFEQKVADGDFDQFAEPAYAQRGARRITIPFDYGIDDLFVNLRVQEVGGGLDSMIRGDQSVALNFKPGEGKLLRVTVIKPDRSANGDLAYHNQRKLIGRPVANQMMVYHMVYQRPLQSDSSRMQCFYRRSTPISPVHSDRPLSWESTEVALGASVLRDGSGTGTMRSCAYPALVVRKDSNDQDWVYVVYACREESVGAILSNPQTEIIIAEQMFDAAANLSGIGSTGRFIATARGQSLADWGTPVIGAAHGGNFIAWSDSLQGIGITHRSPEQGSAYATPNYLHRDSGAGPYDAAHPALTSYARLELDEADAGLVWQEDDQIYYTRVELGGAGVSNFIQNHYTHTQDSHVLESRRMLRLGRNLNCFQNRRPSIYRHIDSSNVIRDSATNDITMIIDMDEVAWEARKVIQYTTFPPPPSPYGAWEVHHLSILNVDGYAGGLRHRFRGMTNPPGRIRSFEAGQRDISEPNLAQGDFAVTDRLIMGGSLWEFNGAEDVVLLNLRQGAQRLWDFKMAIGTWKRLWDTGEQLTDYGHRDLLLGNGRTPQLAAIHTLDETINISRGRRVFVDEDEHIRPSAQYFQKGAEDVRLIRMQGFADWTTANPNDCARVGAISLAKVAGSIVPFEDPVRLREIQVGSPPQTALDLRRYPDTIRTDSFSIAASADLTLDFLGADLSFMQLDLVRNSDGQRSSLTIPAAADDAVARTTYQLINGGGQMFHLELTHTSSNATYTHEVILGDLPIIGGGFARAGEQKGRKQLVNLADGVEAGNNSGVIGLAAWPQPASDVVNFGAWFNYEQLPQHFQGMNTDIELQLQDLTGRVCRRRQLSPGSSLAVDLADLAPGVYMLKATAQHGREIFTGAMPLILRR